MKLEMDILTHDFGTADAVARPELQHQVMIEAVETICQK